jgi:hypothetical protein
MGFTAMFSRGRKNTAGPGAGGVSGLAANKKTRLLGAVILAAAFVTSAAVSVFLALVGDPSRLVFGEWLAPVNINIEMDKNVTGDISILSEPTPNSCYYLSPTGKSAGEKVVIHTELRSGGFHRRIFLRLLKEQAESTLKAVDNISVFIGNKVYYFTGNEARQFERSEAGGYALFRFPEMYYSKSLLIKDWINYYGDFNIALKLLCSFFFSPARFLGSWIFLGGILFLYRKEILRKYKALRGKKYTAAILLALITVFAFCLRVNGFTRHSAWTDELYSATLAANPNTPFLSVFMDGGNPPAYFLLLKYWFRLIGWNEEAGTLLSVLIGVLACPALYLFLKKSVGKRAALLGAFFMAISGFAVGYSQEMRAYILKMALAPFIAFLFFRVIKKPSFANLALYVIPCVIIVNAHYYGILFVMANFVFYCGCYFAKKNRAAHILKFLAANMVIALSFMPFFFYKILVDHDSFNREFVIRPDYAVIFALILLFAAAAFISRKKIMNLSFMGDGKKTGWAYMLGIPALVFTLGFLVSIKKPMIDYRYLMPISYPFLLAVMAAAIAALPQNKAGAAAQVLLVLLLGGGIYTIRFGLTIHGGGYEFYRESRRFITLDTQARPDKKSAMLDNAPRLAAYYHEPEIPEFSPDLQYDLIYVFNQPPNMRESSMYNALDDAALDDSNMVKIIPNEKIVIFKIFSNR